MKVTALAKIAITSSSDVALIQAHEKVNTGNAGGRVTKTELASWLITHLCENLTSALIEQIRADHFDQISYLESLVKNLKQSGRTEVSPTELEKLKPKSKKSERIKDNDATRNNYLKTEPSTTQKPAQKPNQN